MQGDYLLDFERRLDALRMQQRAIKTQVKLNYRVVQAASDMATVVDRVEDDSFFVRPGTEEPLMDPANDVLRLQIKLRKSDGLGKVVESVSAD
jgi:hypothetical protein